LTIVIVHLEPSSKHEKGHKSTSNIELGVILIEFYRFGESMFYRGLSGKEEKI
jgi:hypothetical protein